MTDNNNVLRVLNGYIKLTQEEKLEFLRAVSDYGNADSSTKLITERHVRGKLQLNLGPTGEDHCPCCGKS